MTNKARSNGAKGKSRDKDLEAFDDGKVDKDAAKAEAIEAFINRILNAFISLSRREKAFFRKMINDVKNSKIDGFTPDDFYFLTKFDGVLDAGDRARGALCYYFSSLCNLAEQEEKQQSNQDAIRRYENFKRAVKLLRLALPQGYFFNRFQELEEYKESPDFKKAEVVVYFAEFLRKANDYFNSDSAINHYLKKGEKKQREKDNFRENLNAIADFYKIKAISAIDDGKLTQNICDYVMGNFADFLAEYEKTENDFRKSDK